MLNRQHGQNSKSIGAGRLWAAWFIAIAAWGLHLFASYSLVEWHCRNPQTLSDITTKIMLHSLTVFCFLLALSAGGLAWRSIRTLRERKNSLSNTFFTRSRFMATSGILLSLFLAVIILVQGLPNLVLPPCH